MRIIVTGAAGFIGRHVMRAFGDDAIGLDIVDIQPTNRCVSVKNLGALRALFHDELPDAIVHLAGESNPREYVAREKLWKLNAGGTHNVCTAAAEAHVPLVIFASSSAVYGDHDYPLSEYGRSKVGAELAAKGASWCYPGLTTIGLRLMTVYGPEDRPDSAISSFTRRLAKNKPLPLFNDGENERDWVHIDDVVSAIRAILKRRYDLPCHNFAWFDIGTGHSVPVSRMVDLLAQHMDIPATIRKLPRRPDEPVMTRAEVAPFKRFFGFIPGIPLHEGIETIDLPS